jgi:predicted NAD-dependent protein-ADP-ribosyltransferase YbiA (DUF1768 family)
MLFPSIDQMAETEVRNIGAPEAEVQPQEEKKAYVPVFPYDKAKLAMIEKFFSLRKKSPGQYTFNEAGDLEVKEHAGKGKAKMPPGVIQLARFVPLEPSERESIEDARKTSLSELDQQYEDEIMTLRKAREEYNTTGAMRAVLASNQRLTELDARRNAVRSAIRQTTFIVNPSVKEINLNERYDDRKMFRQNDAIEQYFKQLVVRTFYYTFPAVVGNGKYVQEGEAPEVKEEAETPNEMIYRQPLKDGRFARIFYDTDSAANGFLSPMWAVDFTMQGSGGAIRFSSPVQAYEVERAKELGETALAESLLKTRSPRTIRLLTRKVKGHPANVRGLWMKIYTAVYEQHPILKARLLDTGSDTLVFADVREGPSGIGLGEKDAAALDPAKWKGENAVGVAQETVRTRMREGSEDEAAASIGSANLGGSITEEEQQKAKVAAIINARRFAKR